jgi:competence protein ComEC
MRLPAVAIAAAFACGIVLGLQPSIVQFAPSQTLLLSAFSTATLLVSIGLVFLKLKRLFPAAAISVISWILIGFLGACVAEQPRSAEHVVSLLEAGRLDLKTPLRWYGHVRDEPARLPWGCGYEIELSGVEFESALLSVQGGLRLSLAPQPYEKLMPELHAGDEVAVLAEAHRPQLFRDEGAFDRRAYLAQQNIDLVGTLRAPELIERLGSTSPTVGTRLARVRRRLRDEIDELFAGTPQNAGVLRAMLLGDRSFVDQAEAADFQKTGVFHVLVVAGLHVGAIAFVLYWLGRKLRLSPLWTMSLTLALLLAYVAVVDERPPVLRAALMAALVIVSGFFFRRLELLNSAALAALILLAAKPLALRDSSFQLTFVAMGCIAGLAAPWLEKTVQPYVHALRGWRDVTRDAAQEPRAAQFRIDLRSLAHWLSAKLPQRIGNTTENCLIGGLSLTFRAWELLVITVALQLGMLPLMAQDFHRIALSAPFVNLAAVPLTGIVVPLGFLTLACGLILRPLGKLLAAPLGWLTGLLVHVVQWFAHFPRWSYRIPGPPSWLVLFFFVTGFLLAAGFQVKYLSQRKLVCGLCSTWIISALVIVTFPFGERWTKGKLEVTVLDVGQGDSLFVVFPGGRTLLIDGGGAFSGFPGRELIYGVDPGEEAVSPYLWSRGFKKLDVVALTHAHQDHIGGLTAILENFRIGKLWIGREVSSPALARLEELARGRKIPIEHELNGKSFRWDDVEGEFLWPDIGAREMATPAKNDDSLVLSLHYGNRALLLPGDAEKESERAILAENSADVMRSDVLKVGHHGSKNSTTPELLAAVQPRVGIISAGEGNLYGHPSPELLERLTNAGVRILRTDRDGAVQVLTDGTQMEISCFIPCPETGRVAASRQGESRKQIQHGEKQ